MSIANVPSLFKKIGKGAEGGHEFARLCKKLLASDSRGHNSILELADDSMGDFKKSDARLRLFEYGKDLEELILFQFKFYPSPLSSNHKQSIKKSYIEAANENPNAKIWIIITPEELNKKDFEWLDQIAVKTQKKSQANSSNFPRIEHWGHNRLIDLLLRYKHIGEKYYPELFNSNSGFPTIDKISIDQNLCSWEMSENELTIYPKETDLERFIDLNDEYDYYLLPFEKLSTIDKQMFFAGANLIEERSKGKSTVDSKVLYRGLISKLLFSYEEKKLEYYKKDIKFAEESLQKWWIKPEEFSRDIVEDEDEYLNLKCFHDLFGKSTDPILKITFVNRSENHIVVYSVGFEIIDSWQELGGPPTFATLVPVLADVTFQIVENKTRWIKTLDNAIQVPSNQAMSIIVRLKDYLNIYDVTYMVSGVFEFGISSDRKVKSPKILIAS